MNTLFFLLAFSCSLAAGEAGEASSGDSGADRNVLDNSSGNRDENPRASDQLLRVSENSPVGTVVGTIATSTADVESELRYAITGGNTQGAFAIDAKTGRITVKDARPLDFETNARFHLTVQVKNIAAKAGDNLRYNFAAHLLKSGVDPQAVQQLLNHATLRVTVNLDNVNEHPTVGDRSFRIDEGSPDGTVLGVMTAADPDAGEELHFAITAGNTGDAFAIGAKTGRITVRRGSLLDFRANPRFELTVQVTDLTGVSDTAVVTVNLNEVDEEPAVAVRPPDVAGKETERAMTPEPTPADSVTEKEIDPEKETGNAVAVVPAPSETVTGAPSDTVADTPCSTVVKDAVLAFIASVSRRGDIAVALAMVCLLWFASSRSSQPTSRGSKERNDLQEECKRLHGRLAELDNNIEQLQTENRELAGTLGEQREELVLERAALDAERSRFADERETLRIERELLEDRQRQLTESTSAGPGDVPEVNSGDIFEVDEEVDEEPDNATDDESMADYMRGLLGRSRSNYDHSAKTGTGQAVLETKPLVSSRSVECVDAPAELEAETESVESSPEVFRPRKSVDKQAVRNDIDSFREIANLTARTAITRHARKKQKRRFLVAGSLTAASFAAAVLLLKGESWASPRTKPSAGLQPVWGAS